MGFAMGIERLVLLLEACEQLPPTTAEADVYVVSYGDEAHRAAFAVSEQLRDAFAGLRIVQHAGGGSFKSQMKKADKSGARVALIWGEDEVAAGTVSLKALRGSDGVQPGQQTVAREQLEDALRALLAD